jgi:hypothetical protein
MRVKDLIELLKDFDEESEVKGSYNGGEYESCLDLLKVVEDEKGVVWLKD